MGNEEFDLVYLELLIYKSYTNIKLAIYCVNHVDKPT